MLLLKLRSLTRLDNFNISYEWIVILVQRNAIDNIKIKVAMTAAEEC